MANWFSYAATAAVFIVLAWIVIARPYMLVRPSVLFLGFFWLQVQFASGFNAAVISEELNSPLDYVAVVHGFALALAVMVLITFRGVARRAADRIADEGTAAAFSCSFSRIMALLTFEYAIVAFYLAHVPFEDTGLYALIFDVSNLDISRETSMKLLDSKAVAYAFTIMEKIVAPVAAGFAGALSVKAVRERKLAWLLLSLACLPVIAAPTLLYGARGPASMVVLAYLLTVMLLNVRFLNVRYLAVAVFACLLPIALLSTLKSEDFNLRTIAFHTVNIFDRAIGRSYIDNVWHVGYVQQHGHHGIAGIEKLAPLFGVEPRDILNVVGARYGGRASSAGLAFLNLAEPTKVVPVASQVSRDQLFRSASSGASFATLNFAMFGYWSLPFSIAFVLALDLMLYLYLRMPAVSVAPVAGAIAVPVLNLSFSLMTTVLASKGLVLIPALGLLLSARLSYPARGDVPVSSHRAARKFPVSN